MSQNLDCIQTFCNDRRNGFHLHVVNGIHTIIQVYFMNTYTNTSIFILIFV